MSASPLRAVVIATALCLAPHGSAFAGPPYVTDDPETPARQAWEINVSYVLLQSTDPSTAQAPIFDINYGLTNAIQLKLEVPILYVKRRDGTDVYGLGDALFGVKWRFLDERGRRPQLAVYPQVGLPSGNKRRDLGAGASSYLLPLIAQKSWGPWTAFTNVAWVVQAASGTKDYAYYGAALTREATRTLKLGAEVFGNQPTAPGASSDLGWNVGLEWHIADRYELLASGGHSLQGDAGTTLYLGVEFNLGNQAEK